MDEHKQGNLRRTAIRLALSIPLADLISRVIASSGAVALSSLFFLIWTILAVLGLTACTMRWFIAKSQHNRP